MISKKHFIKGRSNCFCEAPELIENYEQAINDKTQVWVCHKLAKSHIGVSPSNKNKSASIFGEKYIAHFGYGKSINEKQYRHEHYIFTRDGKCSWE